MRKSGLKLWDENFSEGMSFPQGIERSFVDRKRVGEVFIVVFRTDQVNRKTAHHAIVIDVAGSSDEDFLHGLMVHLTANVLTRIVKFRVEDNPWKRDEFYEIVRIGQLLPTTPDPHYWAMELHSKTYKIFNDFTEQMTNNRWTSTVNCQTFARAVIERFGFQWPDELTYAGDQCSPVIIDVTIAMISMKAYKEKKCEEAFLKKIPKE